MKVGVYVDAQNLSRSGGRRMRYDVLRDFASRGGAELVRLNAYVTFDDDRAQTDHEYRNNAWSFQAALRDFGWKVIVKNITWYTDDQGQRFGKADTDMDMGVDALLQSRNLDRVLLCTGDGDFVRVVKALQDKGCQVEVLAFENVSGELRREADVFVSGYQVPRLLGNEGKEDMEWGAPNSRVRGICYWYNHEKGFGFLRYLTRVDGDLRITDTKRPDSPYQTIFIHSSNLPLNAMTPSELPSRNIIFEFDISPSVHKPGETTASAVTIVARI